MSRRLIVIACVGVVAAVSGLIIWLVVGGGAAGPDFREKKPEEIREYLRSEAFRNMDREARWGVARRAMEQMMTSRARAYFELPVEERVVYIDKVIDEMESRRREFRSRRREFGGRRESRGERRREGEGRVERARLGRDGRGGRDGQGRPRWGGGRRRGRRRSPERRRARSEFIDAETRAIRAKFREALRRRMRERGIDFGRRWRR
ncbi:MAG: hypothetical protein ACYS4W_08715 [Planctomycetota bacterium]